MMLFVCGIKIYNSLLSVRKRVHTLFLSSPRADGAEPTEANFSAGGVGRGRRRDGWIVASARPGAGRFQPNGPMRCVRRGGQEGVDARPGRSWMA